MFTEVTEEYESRFRSSWSHAVTAVAAHVIALGAQRADAEDAAQEALIRAWARRLPFLDAADLARWCKVVARNCWVDEMRSVSRRRLAPLASADALAVQDTATLVEQRDVLNRVVSGMDRLTANERDALLFEGAATDRREQVRLGVTRHRARRRLIAAVGEGSVFAAFLAWARRTLRALPITAPSTVAAAVVAVWLLPLGGLAATPGSPLPEQPRSRLLPSITVAGTAQDAPGHSRTPHPRSAGAVPRPQASSPVPALVQVNPTVTRRDKQPADHLLCVDDSTLGKHCLDLPSR